MTNTAPRPSTRTTALFLETCEGDKSGVLWTLKDSEHKGYPSLYQRYMDSNDPSEYFFALEVIGSWRQWLRISSSPSIRPVIDRWRLELEAKIKSTALKALLEKSLIGDVSAAKYLIETWSNKPGEKRGRGRPKKEKEDNSINIDWKKDLERIQDDNR